MQAKDIQLAFLNRVKSTLPEHVSLAEELAELLSTSTDSAYRRMRGDKLLSIDEIAKICAHYKIPFDATGVSIANSVSFRYLRIGDKEENFSMWLSTLLGDLKSIASVPGSHVLYAADDVPIWHHFYDEKLAAFKLFYWLKSIMNAPEYRDLKFNPKHVKQEYIDNAKQLLKEYDKVKSTEIWSEDTLNSTLKQVEYFWESGFFETREDALEICDLIEGSIKVLLNKCELECKLGKDSDKNFQFYHSEVMIGNNSVLVDLGNQKVAYVSNNTFNMMSTATPEFVEENSRWLQNLARKSILISGVSEKQRNKYFNVLFNKINEVRRTVNQF
jgi:hypothetical protein